jgi:hypothetical protein
MAGFDVWPPAVLARRIASSAACQIASRLGSRNRESSTAPQQRTHRLTAAERALVTHSAGVRLIEDRPRSGSCQTCFHSGHLSQLIDPV